MHACVCAKLLKSRPTLCDHLDSIRFSCSVVSDSLRPHGLQHARTPSLSPTPGVYSNSWTLSQWCHPTISSSVMPFSSCLQSFPASGSFPMSQFFASSGQSIGVWASASVLAMNIQDWFPLGWTGWISLKSKGLSRVFSNTTVQKHQFFSFHFHQFFIVQLSHPYMTIGKTIALTRPIFVGKVMSLLFNNAVYVGHNFSFKEQVCFNFTAASPSTVIFELPKIKSAPVSTVSPSIFHEVTGLDAMILIFQMLNFKPTFSLSSFIFIKRLFSSSSLSAKRVVSSGYLRLLIFLLAILILACASSSLMYTGLYSWCTLPIS